MVDKSYTVAPNQVLPPEYGGTGSTVEELTKYWIDQVIFLVVFSTYWFPVVCPGTLQYWIHRGRDDKILDGTDEGNSPPAGVQTENL